MAKRTLDLVVRVRVPKAMTVQEARREIRTLVNEQCNWSAEPEDVRVVSVRPVPRAPKGRA